MRHVAVALAVVASLSTISPAGEPPQSFVQPSAVLLHVSERDLNRIVVDTFHANGGPRFVGAKKRVSPNIADLHYDALFSDPVLRLDSDGTARLSLGIKDASLRIGRFEREIGGLQTRCEDAGLDVDPDRPVGVELAFALAVERGALKITPKSVRIPDAEDRLRLVEPSRCKNALLPHWFLWGLGKPYLRHSLGSLDEIILKRARASASRLEKKESLLSTHWALPWERGRDSGSRLKLVPDSLKTSQGSLQVGLSATGVDPALRGAPTRELEADGSLPPGSFLGLSETFMNEVARRAVSDASRSRRNPIGNFRRLRASDAVYALVPGLRKLASKENIYFELAFPNAPRFEFSRLEGASAGSSGSGALIRVHFSGVEINIRSNEQGQGRLLGTLHVDSGRMAVIPFASRLGGISFRLVENQWRVSSTGLEFDEALAAATLQELTFGKIFATTYEPLLRRAMHLGETEFLPQTFAVNGGYLVIGLDAPPPSAGAAAAVVSTRTDNPLGSR